MMDVDIEDLQVYIAMYLANMISINSFLVKD